MYSVNEPNHREWFCPIDQTWIFKTAAHRKAASDRAKAAVAHARWLVSRPLVSVVALTRCHLSRERPPRPPTLTANMAIDPRKRTAAAQPSPWYVHPFEAHTRGATNLLVYYTRSLSDSQRGELFADVLHRLYGDYYRHAPKREGESMRWYCPAKNQRGADIEGTPNADNAVVWVEVDALHSMLVYLASGDFFRLCNDFARELELDTAMMSAEEAREEIHRASNVLTAYYDIQVDVGLRDAIVEHITKHDPRWLRNAPADPDTPPTRVAWRRRSAASTPDGSSDKENDDDGDAWTKFKLSLACESAAPKGLALRRANSMF